MLTKRQQQTLDFIASFQQQKPGAAPTLEEIRVGLGLASRGTSHRLLASLESAGQIRRDNKSRSLEIIRAPEQVEAAA
jgi:SOS-response transcriptional repressor LexA